MKKVLPLCALLAMLLSCLLPEVSAQAAPVVVGSPLALEFKSAVNTAGLFTTITNTALGEEGAHVTSPVAGTIVRWRTKGTFAGGGFRLRVLRPIGGGQYVGAGASSFQTPVGSSLQVFSTNLPIESGDLVGLDGENEATTYSEESSPKSSWNLFSPSFPEASSSPLVASGAGEIGFDAEVVPVPALILIGPTSGGLAGGTTVTIAGRDLEGATAVKFGPNAASANFSVKSDDEIKAVSPPAAKPGTVDVTVTTPGGTSAPVPNDQFTYVAPALPATPALPAPPQPEPLQESCTVPRLIGRTLTKARKRLREAKCRLGKVRRAGGVTARNGNVMKQTPKPGRVVATGTKVNIKLG